MGSFCKWIILCIFLNLTVISPILNVLGVFSDIRPGKLANIVKNNYLVLLHNSDKQSHENIFHDIISFAQSLGVDEYGEHHVSCNYNFSIGALAGVKVKGTWEKIKALKDKKGIKIVEPLMEWRALDETNDDPVKKKASACLQENTGKDLWGLSRVSVRETPSYSKAKYTYLANDGQGVTVYVVDTGVYIDHSDLKGRASWGFTANRIAQTSGNRDDHGHGTHVSGTIAGTTYGLAKNANIIAVKVLDKDGVGSTADVLEGLDWIYRDYASRGKGKAVINMSLGGFAGATSIILESALLELISSGITVSVAAGNDAGDACQQSPARLGEAITVAASDSSDQLASFSNFGPCVDIAAPGDNILSAYIGSPDATARYRGTSMSAPHVAGIVARYMSQRDSPPSPAEVKGWLLQSATQGRLEMSTTMGTPNLLLYMPCEAVQHNCVLDLSNYGYDGEVMKRDRQIFWMSIGMGVLALLAIASLGFACYVKRNRGQGQEHYRTIGQIYDSARGQGERQKILGYENRGAIYT